MAGRFLCISAMGLALVSQFASAVREAESDVDRIIDKEMKAGLTHEKHLGLKTAKKDGQKYYSSGTTICKEEASNSSSIEDTKCEEKVKNTLEQIKVISKTGLAGLPEAAEDPDGCSAIAKLQKEILKSGGNPGTLDCSADCAHIGSCIGGVLASPDTFDNSHASECCAAGTEYDHFLLNAKNKVEVIAEEDFAIDNETALLIIDVQKDFTVGSFAQPCWGTGGSGMVDDIIKLAQKTAKAGGIVVASKDLHPATHCSFDSEHQDEGTVHQKCKNTKNYDEEKFTADMRYVNEFPSHCSFTFDGEDGKRTAVPQKAPDTPFCKFLLAVVFQGKGAPEGHFCGDDSFVGANLDPTLQEALAALPKDQVEIIFKGFHQEYDSFSAMPHVGTSSSKGDETRGSEEAHTGGYALKYGRARPCHAKWDNNDCYPTEKELESPGGMMRSIVDILNGDNGEKVMKKLIVVGLVYDFCVKETAIFAKELAGWQGNVHGGSKAILAEKNRWRAGDERVNPLEADGRNAKVTIIGSLARPSFDGKPGSPYTKPACDGGAAEGHGFCTQGGGTTPAHEAHLKDIMAGGVEFVRFAQKTCGA